MEKELLAYYSLLEGNVPEESDVLNVTKINSALNFGENIPKITDVAMDSDVHEKFNYSLPKPTDNDSNSGITNDSTISNLPLVNSRNNQLRYLVDTVIDNFARTALPPTELIVESCNTESSVEQSKSTIQQHIQNAAEVLSNVASETFLFTMDRSKSFTDSYVTGMIFKDDPEYLHYQYFANAQYSQQSPNYWKLKCYLASLSWYQKQLIIETKSMTDIDNCLIDNSSLPDDAASVSSNGNGKDVHSLKIQHPSQLINEYEEIQKKEIIEKEDHGSDDGNSEPIADTKTDQGTILTHTSNWNNVTTLLQSATNGDILAQQQLHQLFSPPSFIKAPYCMLSTCHKMFTVACFRHHCRHCGLSFCTAHVSKYHRIQKFGFATSTVRVCDACYAVIELEEYRDKILWRMLRLKAYYEGNLIPYFEKRTDRGIDKVLRYAAL